MRSLRAVLVLGSTFPPMICAKRQCRAVFRSAQSPETAEELIRVGFQKVNEFCEGTEIRLVLPLFLRAKSRHF